MRKLSCVEIENDYGVVKGVKRPNEIITIRGLIDQLLDYDEIEIYYKNIMIISESISRKYRQTDDLQYG